MLGQSSGGWTESSSALRLLNVGIRNSIGVLTDDAFTQTNPTAVATNVSTKVNTGKLGVLSGSVAFTRPDVGSNYVGGPGSNVVQTAICANVAQKIGYTVLGLFINSADGNPYENLPAVASGVGPYVSGMGSYGDALYETSLIGAAVGGDPAAGAAIVYVNGLALISSRNGFLTPQKQLNAAGVAIVSCDSQAIAAQSFVAGADNSSTVIGILKMPPDSVDNELVFDQRI
jgi:hypothetical protein